MLEESAELPKITGAYTRIREKFIFEEARQETSAKVELALIEEALGVSFEEIPRKVKPRFRDVVEEMTSLISFLLPDGGRKITRFFKKKKK